MTVKDKATNTMKLYREFLKSIGRTSENAYLEIDLKEKWRKYLSDHNGTPSRTTF